MFYTQYSLYSCFICLIFFYFIKLIHTLTFNFMLAHTHSVTHESPLKKNKKKYSKLKTNCPHHSPIWLLYTQVFFRPRARERILHTCDVIKFSAEFSLCYPWFVCKALSVLVCVSLSWLYWYLKWMKNEWMTWLCTYKPTRLPFPPQVSSYLTNTV